MELNNRDYMKRTTYGRLAYFYDNASLTGYGFHFDGKPGETLNAKHRDIMRSVERYNADLATKYNNDVDALATVLTSELEALRGKRNKLTDAEMGLAATNITWLVEQGKLTNDKDNGFKLATIEFEMKEK